MGHFLLKFSCMGCAGVGCSLNREGLRKDIFYFFAEKRTHTEEETKRQKRKGIIM